MGRQFYQIQVQRHGGAEDADTEVTGTKCRRREKWAWARVSALECSAMPARNGEEWLAARRRRERGVPEAKGGVSPEGRRCQLCHRPCGRRLSTAHSPAATRRAVSTEGQVRKPDSWPPRSSAEVGSRGTGQSQTGMWVKRGFSLFFIDG